MGFVEAKTVQNSKNGSRGTVSIPSESPESPFLSVALALPALPNRHSQGLPCPIEVRNLSVSRHLCLYLIPSTTPVIIIINSS
jgi:hypothetical protein